MCLLMLSSGIGSQKGFNTFSQIVQLIFKHLDFHNNIFLCIFYGYPCTYLKLKMSGWFGNPYWIVFPSDKILR